MLNFSQEYWTIQSSLADYHDARNLVFKCAVKALQDMTISHDNAMQVNAKLARITCYLDSQFIQQTIKTLKG